ncbi:MAG: hypothetical protein ACLU30_05885 [Odoribacter splanchnicus]
MIRKSILWIAMFFAACTEVWAEAAQLWSEGLKKPLCITVCGDGDVPLSGRSKRQGTSGQCAGGGVPGFAG